MDNQNNQPLQGAAKVSGELPADAAADNSTVSQPASNTYYAPSYGTPAYGTQQTGSAAQAQTQTKTGTRVKSLREQMFDNAVAATPLGLLALVALVFGSLTTEFLFRGGFAIGITIVTVLFYAAFLPFILRKGNRISATAIILAVPQLIMAASFSFNSSRSGRFWMILATFGLFMLQTTILAGCTKRPSISVPGAVDAVYTHVGAPLENLGATLKALFTSKGDKKEKRGAIGVSGKIVLGLVISIPFIIILLAIFAAADAAFKAELTKILDWIALKIDIGALVLDLVVGAMLCVYYIPLVLSLRCGYSRERKPDTHRRWLDPIIGATVLFASSLVYIMFIIVQFKYFFAVHIGYYFDYDYTTKLTLPDNMTWAEYARSGFFELSTIIIITVAVIGLVMYISKNDSKGNIPLVVRIALTVLAVCNVAITCSAVLRMRLYTIWCGLTAKRIGVLFIIAAMALCLIAVVIKLWCRKMRLTPCIAVISIAAVTLFGCMNVDAVCANVNVERHITDGTSIDMKYLGELSYAAAPSVERLMNESPDADVRKAAEGLLAKYYFIGDSFSTGTVPLKETVENNRIGDWTLDHQRALTIYRKYNIPKSAIKDYGLYIEYCEERSDAEQYGWDFYYDSFAEYALDHDHYTYDDIYDFTYF